MNEVPGSAEQSTTSSKWTVEVDDEWATVGRTSHGRASQRVLVALLYLLGSLGTRPLVSGLRPGLALVRVLGSAVQPRVGWPGRS